VTIFVIRHGRLHKLVHRIAAAVGRDCWICASVWAYLEAMPGFNEGMREAEADFAAGRFAPFTHKVPRP
jgi:hypothetical protein